MKKERNNKVVIILMGIIIIILAVLCILFAINKISLNTGSVKNDEVDNNLELKDEHVENDQINEYTIEYETEELVTKNNKGKIIFKSTYNFPILTNKNNQVAADKISNYFKEKGKNWKETEQSNHNDFIEVYQDSEKDLNLGINYLFSTEVMNSNRITIKYVMSGSMGGVSWSDIAGYNFDANTGELLTLENISNNFSEFINIMKAKLVSEIKKQDEILKNENSSGLCLNNDWEEQVHNKNFEENDWYFTSDGIKLVIPKYEIACGAAGVIEVLIENSEINDFLLDQYQYNLS